MDKEMRDINASSSGQRYDKKDILLHTIDDLDKKNKRLTKLVIFLGVLVLLCCVALAITIIKLNKSNKKVENVDTVNVAQGARKIFMVDNLASYTSGIKAENCTLSTTKVSDFEYLLITIDMKEMGKQVKLYYRNEYSTENKDGAFSTVKDGLDDAYLECDGKKVTVDKEITADLASLIPMTVNIAGVEKGVLFYGMSEDAKTPTHMTLYNVDTMEYKGSINFKETLYTRLACRQTEDEGNVVTFGSAEDEMYKYRISDLSFNNFKSSGKYAVNLFEDYSCDFNKDGVSFKNYVHFSNNEYLGEYTIVVDYQENGINFAKVSFDAYVGFDYEDSTNDRIVTPRESYIEDGLRIWGDRGGHYVVPLYEKLKRDDYTQAGPYKIVQDESKWEYTNPTTGAKTLQGIDVSAYQEWINWDKVKEDGIEFVILRAGYRGYSKGKIVEDEYLERNLREALARDIKVGVYIFSQAIDDEEAIEEAKFLIQKVSQHEKFDGPIVFDTEQYDEPKDARANLITREQRTSLTKAFCETVKEAGYLPVVYANTKWMLFGVDMDELAEYPTWYAYYGKNPILPYHFDIWQYTSEGKVSGVTGPVDMNIMFEDVFGKSTK